MTSDQSIMDGMPQIVRDTYLGYDPAVRQSLLTLRSWVLDIAQTDKRVGRVCEELKWGEPSFVLSGPRSGTTLRLAATPKRPAFDFGVFVPCQTSLIATCRELYGDLFTYDKDRGLLFSLENDLPEVELRHFIALALTYYVK